MDHSVSKFADAEDHNHDTKIAFHVLMYLYQILFSYIFVK